MKLLILGLLLTSNLYAKDYKFSGQDYPPFNYMENGKAVGAMVDIVGAICAITKDNCTVEIMPLKRAMTLLESGEHNAVLSLLKNPERDAFANFSPSIIKMDNIYVTTNDKPSISSVAELKGWNIGAVASTASFKIASAHAKEAGDGTKVTEDADNETVVKKIASGRYGDKGAIIINEAVLAFLTKKNSITNLKKLFVAKSDDYGIYFSKKSVDQASFDKFSAAIEQIKKNGELAKILNKYNVKN